MVIGLSLAASPLCAKQPSPAREPITRGWTATVSSATTYTDNLFEEGPTSSPRADVFTTLRAEGRREVRRSPWWLPSTIGLAVGGDLYDRTEQADNVFYEVDLRKRLSWGRPSIYYRGTPRRLLFIEETPRAGAPPEQQNVFYSQNTFGTEVERVFLDARQLRLGIGYEAELRNFRPAFDERDYVGHFPNLDGRYVVSPLFVPRLRGGYEIQDARTANRTRRGIKTMAGFDGAWRRARWDMRWYLTRWNYDAALPGDSNFDRHDTRHAFVLTGALRVWRDLSITTRYRFLTSNSTRTDRDFSKNEVGGGVAYRF